MTTQTELHNRLAGEIVKSIVAPIITNGGQYTDVMVLTESVLVGVALTCIKLGGDEKALDVMVDAAKKRLAEIRLGGIGTKGRA
jgi:hypothetical protein